MKVIKSKLNFLLSLSPNKVQEEFEIISLNANLSQVYGSSSNSGCINDGCVTGVNTSCHNSSCDTTTNKGCTWDQTTISV